MKKELSEAVKKIYDAIKEAEDISNKTGEGFYLEPCYAMGGFYNPEDENEYTGTNWHPSSLGC